MKADLQGTDTPREEGPGDPPEADRAPEATQEASAEQGEREQLRKALEEERSKGERFLANWQRAQADYLNFRRRAEEEKRELGKYAGASVAASLLPVLDDLERALGSIPGDLANFTWVEGVFLVYKKLLASLESQGLKAIEAEGKPFDPRYHDAVLYGEGDEGKVLAELQRGYVFKEMVLRPSLVKVGKRPEPPSHPPPADKPQDKGEVPPETQPL